MKTTLAERLDVDVDYSDWELSEALFGDAGGNFYDFEAFNYTYFIDHVRTQEELIHGLGELSPMADDALDLSMGLTEQEFRDFKIALAHERRVAHEDGDSTFPRQYDELLLPQRFIEALIIVEKFEMPLGAALIRLLQHEETQHS